MRFLTWAVGFALIFLMLLPIIDMSIGEMWLGFRVDPLGTALEIHDDISLFFVFLSMGVLYFYTEIYEE